MHRWPWQRIELAKLAFLRRPVSLVAVALFTACDSLLTKPSLYNTVDVIVARRNGLPVPGANVALYTGQRPMGYGVTGSDGRFTFTRVPQGLYGVITSPPTGYNIIESLITAPSSLIRDDLLVAGDTLSPVRFTLLKEGPGTIVVRALQTDGSPISGASIIAYDPSKQNGETTTDVTGGAVFPSLSFGVHGVVVIRPLYYRDYRTPGDSLYAYRDNIVVDEGSRDSVVFRFERCAGTVRALVLDETGAPVPRTTALFYTSTQELAVRVTADDGRAEFPPAPCATQLGVFITPAAGYTVAPGRGSQFIDGITVVNGVVTDLTFRVRRSR